MEPVEKARFGEAVEVLEDGMPLAELIGKSPPRAAIVEQIPQAVEVRIQFGATPSCMDNVVAREAPVVTLIF